MSSLDIIRAMEAAGCDEALILKAVRAHEEERVTKRRASDAERQRRHRASKAVTNVTRDERDVRDQRDSVEPHIQHAPTRGEDNPSRLEPTGDKTPSLRSGDVHSQRRTIEAEFDATFWPAYPHKVSKGAARKAWLSARRKADLETIMAGLQRYVETKPPDINWRNPATFLNGEGWDDQPQAAPPARAHGPPRHLRGSAALFHVLDQDFPQ